MKELSIDQIYEGYGLSRIDSLWGVVGEVGLKGRLLRLTFWMG